MKYDTIDSSLFVENRKRLAKRLKPNSIAIFTANPLMPKSADATYKWRQNPDLFYLTGVDQEETFLVIYPDATQTSWKEVLFVRETNEHIAVWEGEKLSKEDAKKVSGIATIQWSSSFDNMLATLILQAENVYLNLNENDRAGESPLNGELQFAKQLKERFPLHNFERLAPIMHD